MNPETLVTVPAMMANLAETGLLGPYITMRVRQNKAKTICATAAIELGYGLIALKRSCHHGHFGPLLNKIGLERSKAQRLMACARRFANSPRLIQAAGSQTKLIELLMLEIFMAEDLERTGQTGGLRLDDITRMTIGELRRAIIKAMRNCLYATLAARQIFARGD